ncbi:putative membrane protein [Dyadobacter jejuensis]|uniref:Putative membrane protein n=1 Tax=Dyadobacter jejuensis TaxID=1082580 RepID=A0A316ARP8_9BACT|nr:chitobiase/beta-hexosaminidase C-terminal domain-containing protein [Dyadobacter jejuensis]PWJ60111.1 putative membrane protein [Dyadobacter jejuensis]
MSRPTTESTWPFDLKAIVYNMAFFLNGLLLFLLVFEEQFTVPGWLQPLGRLHPLVLHFPLVVLLLYAFWVLLVEKPDSVRWHQQLSEMLLLLGVFTAVIAAFSGFILSHEAGYEGETLFWHKWLGIWISVGSAAWFGLIRYLPPWKLYAKLVAGSMVVALLIGGHLGGNLTHGEDFLTGAFLPSKEDTPRVAMEQAFVYEHLVQPVLEQKCYSCHNDQKAKGELRMQTQDLLLKGGKNGILWDTTQANLGLLISRLHLPIDDKKHMPPRGKPQLTDEEVVLLAAWVKGGSRFDQKVAELEATDPVYAYAQKVIGGDRQQDHYDFEAASADQIAKLNTSYRLIAPLATGSPALAVNFYNRAQFKASDIQDILPLKEQVVSMDLSKMPIKDEDLKLVGQFTQLRTLILNFTDLQGTSLGELSGLAHMKLLSLSGTAVKSQHLEPLKRLPALQKVFVWSTGISPQELAQLKWPNGPEFQSGFDGDTVVIALTPPVIENEKTFLKRGTQVSLRHQIPGVSMRYTLDGSEPDSLLANLYKGPITIDKNTNLKVKAFKPGWLGSAKRDKLFLIAGQPIDSVRLLYEPEKKYSALGAAALNDGIKSDAAMGSGKWLGYRNTDFGAMLHFDKPVTLSSVTLSMFRKLDSYIFPPVKIEVWGGPDEEHLKRLKVIQVDVPKEKSLNMSNISYTTDFPSQDLSCIKVMAYPLSKLPVWHPGKGEKAWIFIDELLVN